MNQPKPGTTVPSSSGGVITYTKTGLRHTAGKAYSGRAAAEEQAVSKTTRRR